MVNQNHKIKFDLENQLVKLSDDFSTFRRTAESNDHRLNNENMLLKTEKNNLLKDLSNQKSDMHNILNSQKAEIE